MADRQSFLEKHDFLLRRLHSITGVLPIGLFLIIHLTTNASIVWGLLDERQRHAALEIVGKAPPGSEQHAGNPGVLTFAHEVHFIHSLPFLIFMEVFGLWLPIFFHSIYGFYIVKTGRSNVHLYKYGANWRYFLQRISGYVGFLFIFYHIATLRWGWTFLIPGGTAWSAEASASTMAAAIQGSKEGFTTVGLAVAIFYFLGASLLVFHFANGLWTWAITWGLTISEAAQKRWGYVCAGVGIAMMLLAWAAVIGFATLKYPVAVQMEKGMAAGPHAPQPIQEAATAPSLPATQH